MLNGFMPMGEKGKWTVDVVLQPHLRFFLYLLFKKKQKTSSLFIMFKFFV